MYEITALPKTIVLGYLGESGVKTIEVDCTTWLEDWPEGELIVTFLPPGGARAFPLLPSQLTIEAGVLTIFVRGAMMNTSGYGELNIRLVDNKNTIEDDDDDIRKYSAIIKTIVHYSHGAELDDTPDAIADWVEEAVLLSANVTAEEALRVAAEDARSVWEEYNPETSYVVGNKVTHEGSSYICSEPSLGNPPTDEDYWLMIARKGTTYLPTFEVVEGSLLVTINEV